MPNKLSCIDSTDSGVSNSSDSFNVLSLRSNHEVIRDFSTAEDISLEEISRVLSLVDCPHHLDSLTEEMLCGIFEKLNSMDRLNCSRVCSKWRRIVSQQHMWTEIAVSGLNCFDMLYIGQFVGFHGFSVQKIDMEDASGLIPQALRFLTPLSPDLVYLRLRRLRKVSLHSVLRFVGICDNLQQIDLSKSEFVQTRETRSTIRKGANVTYLNLSKCDSVDSHVLTAWSQILPNLAVIHLRHCCRLTDSAISRLVENCPNLTEVVVDFCPLLTNNAFVEISKLGGTLRKLSARHSLVSDLGVHFLSSRCGNVTDLNLDGCQHVGESGVVSLSRHCLKLRVIDLSGTGLNDMSLQSLIRSVGCLECVSIEGCPNISDQLVEVMVNQRNVVIFDKYGRRRKSHYSTCLI